MYLQEPKHLQAMSECKGLPGQTEDHHSMILVHQLHNEQLYHQGKKDRVLFCIGRTSTHYNLVKNKINQIIIYQNDSPG